MMKRSSMPLYLVGISLVLVCALLWQLMPPASAQREVMEEAAKAVPADKPASPKGRSLIRLNSGDIDVKSPEAAEIRRQAPVESAGKQLHLIKFNGPIKREWYEGLEKSGLEIVNYIPDYAYLVYGEPTEIEAQQENARTAGSPIEWDGTYLPSHRIQPGVYVEANEKNGEQARLSSGSFLIQLYKDPAANDVTKGVASSTAAANVRNEWEISKYVNFVADLDEAGLKAMAERPDVISIAPWIEPTKNDERQNLIMAGNLTGNGPTPGDYLQYLADRGFTQEQFDASNFVVNVSDDGLDAGAGPSPTFLPLPPLTQFNLLRLGDFAGGSRIAYNRPYGTATQFHTQGCDGHGNLNASIVAGYVPGGAPYNAAPHADASGFRWGLGVAPFVKVGSSTIFTHTAFTNPNIPVLEAEAYASGARISTNSWGANTGGGYNANSQTYDIIVRDARSADAGNQEYTIFFSAGNAGSGLNTVGAPGTGKNVITVGAAENVNPFNGADGCGINDSGANSANDIISFSSRGPTDDGRIKPEIVAPGTHVSGTVQQQNALTGTPVSGTGQAASCWDGTGVCGGVGTGLAGTFFPGGGQQFYSASSGTSHSTPAVAGFGALIRQHFINAGLTPPSPAMMKAVLMNTARYMTGTGANDDLWSNSQGMGMTSMNNYFDGLFGGARIMQDQSNLFTESGQQQALVVTAADNAKPLRITLTWSDKEGSTTAGTLVNNLDLEVIAGGQVYHGNNFDGEVSSAGGEPDAVNNAESIFLPAGVAGPIAVRVRAANIAGDGVPGNGNPLDQDYALVIQNAVELTTPVPILVSDGVRYFSDNGNNNGVPDPGEKVAVTLGLRNAGTASADVSATLQASGGITNPLPPTHSFGTLAPDGPVVSRIYTFEVPADAACNSTITTSFSVTDGGGGLTVSEDFLLGALFSAGPVSIPGTGTSGAAGPYPSTVNVVGVPGPVTDVKLELTGFSHTFPGDVDMVLVAPSGESLVFMSDLGSGTDAVDLNLTFDDAAASLPPTALVSGTFRPSNATSGDTFPAPGPGSAYQSAAPIGAATFASVFGGINPNGEWKLFIVDDASGDGGSLAQWKLTINGVTSVCSPALPDLSVGGQIIFPKPGGQQLIRLVLTDLADGATSEVIPHQWGPYTFTGVRPGRYRLTAISDYYTFEPTEFFFNLTGDSTGNNFYAKQKPKGKGR